MRKWTKKIGCFAMAAAMFLSVDLGGLSIQNVQAAGTYTVSGNSREAIQKCLDEAKNAGGGTVVHTISTMSHFIFTLTQHLSFRTEPMSEEQQAVQLS